METIVLVIHLILALAIISLVLIQRSSGGGLGIGGGAGDFATARSTANALTKMTTWLAIAFFGTSLTLAWLAGHNKDAGVLDTLDTQIQSEQMAPAVEPAPETAIPATEPEIPVSGQ